MPLVAPLSICGPVLAIGARASSSDIKDDRGGSKERIVAQVVVTYSIVVIIAVLVIIEQNSPHHPYVLIFLGERIEESRAVQLAKDCPVSGL